MSESKSLTVSPGVKLQNMLQSESFKDKIALSLPKHCKPDRFARIALLAVNRTPKLLQCTQASLLQCLYDLSAVGLEPDGRRAHLIPYGDQCTLIIDYKGLAELVRRSGDVSDLHSDVICEHDDFSYCFGTGSHLTHKVALGKPRGEVVGAYSYVRLKDGSDSFEVMSKDEIEAIRKRSRSGNNGPWKTDWNEMAKKTVFRRHSKWLPISPELRDVVDREDEPTLSPVQKSDIARPVFSAEPSLDLDGEGQIEQADDIQFESAAPAPEEPAKPVAQKDSWVVKLEDLLLDSGITEDQLIAWAVETKHLSDKVSGLEEVKDIKLMMFVRNFAKIKEAIQK